MQRIEMEDLVARYTAAWNSCDVEAVVACFSEDAVNRDVALRVPVQGREGIATIVTDFMNALPYMIMGIPATGRHVEYDGCRVMRIDADGLISTLTNCWDVAGALHQIGVLEPDPTHVPRARTRGAS